MKVKNLRVIMLLCVMLVTNLIAQPALKSLIYEGGVIAEEGAWCWFADPRALHYENESGNINCSYVGYIDTHGTIKAVQYDFNQKRRTEVLVRSYFQPDDHNNPTFLVLPDERVMIFYSRHTDEPCFYYRISQKPGDITTLGEEKKIMTKDNTTYPSPFILSDDPEHIYLCWRGIKWHPTIARLTMPDEHDNVNIDWGPYQMVQSTGARPYAKYCSNGKDRIMLAYTTGHPDNENPNWLYYNAVNINTLQLEDVQGRTLSTIAEGPLRVTRTPDYAEQNPMSVVDRTPGWRDWVWQVSFNEVGNPVIAMVKISGDKRTHDYYYAYWDGTQWKKIFLAHGGGHFHQSPDIEHCYSGGMAIDPACTNEVYCSVPVVGAFGKMYEIVKFTINFTTGEVKQQQITRHSRKNNVRPFILNDSEASPLRLTWMHGDYYDWILSSARAGYPTSIHGVVQWDSEPVKLNDGVIAQSEQEGMNGKVKVDKKWNSSDFTLAMSINVTDEKAQGVICEGKDWCLSIDSLSLKPCLKIGGDEYKSVNVWGTADSWKNFGRGTNGKWYPVELYKELELVMTYSDNRVRLYINGLLDMNVEGICGLKGLRLGRFNGSISTYAIYNRAFNPDEVGAWCSFIR
jgi:hypothetical protein